MKNFFIILLFLITIMFIGCGNQNNKEGYKTKGARIEALPEGAEILFISNRDTGERKSEIYSMNADGSNQKRITNTDEFFHFINGMDKSRRYIVTSRSNTDTKPPEGLGAEDERSIWIIDLEKKEEKRLVGPGWHSEGDSFSPDSEWIVFLMNSEEKKTDLYKIRRDGSELTQLTDTETVIEGDPAWSNDGKRIAFASLDFSNPEVEVPRFKINTMDPDGNNIKTIFDRGDYKDITIPNVWPPGNFDPSWSPDDEWIVFERAVEYDEKNPQNFGSGNWHIIKVKSDGSGEYVDLSELGGHSDRAEYLPSFSPDGNHIVFGSIYYNEESPKDSHNDIFVMDADTGEIEKRLTKTPGKTSMYPYWIQ